MPTSVSRRLSGQDCDGTVSDSPVFMNHFITLALTFRHCAKIDQHCSLQPKGAACLAWWVLHSATIYQFHMYSPKLPSMWFYIHNIIFIYLHLPILHTLTIICNQFIYRNRKSLTHHESQGLQRSICHKCIQGAIRWPKIQRSGFRSSCQSMCAPQSGEYCWYIVEYVG